MYRFLSIDQPPEVLQDRKEGILVTSNIGPVENPGHILSG